MKIVVKVPVKPRQGPLRTQTGAGPHKTDRNYSRKAKHRNKEYQNAY